MLIKFCSSENSVYLVYVENGDSYNFFEKGRKMRHTIFYGDVCLNIIIWKIFLRPCYDRATEGLTCVSRWSAVNIVRSA